MLGTRSDIISRLLTSTVQELDIPPALRAAATAEYQRVGEWLASHADAQDGWVVHPQGSFLLNTVVLPSLGDEYDVDTVCRRGLNKQQTTQARLKQEVGESLDLYRALQEGPDGPRALKERNRCWALLYPSRLRFHLDVLPAIPNLEGGPSAILITDKELRNWQFSDPLAYAEWFKAQSELEFVQKRMVLAEAARTPPQAIPDWQVKTTLHRVVQVLKAHRNEHFRDELDMRPASILITTLAAHAYRGEQDLMDAVLEAIELMPDYIEETDDGPQVLNPVEPRENFADRWRAKPVLERRFHEWLEKLAEDVREASSQHGLQKVAARLSESFGEQPVHKAMEDLGETYNSTRRGATSRSRPAPGYSRVPVSCPSATTGSSDMAGDRKTLPQQMGGLARLELTTSVSVSHGRLHWTGTLQPTPVSATYRIELAYRGGNRAPDVRVVSPKIRPPEGRRLPHVYPGERLCLCYPGEWNAGKMIARTIIPWASEWLAHYEIWTFTGHWHGGGHEPAEG